MNIRCPHGCDNMFIVDAEERGSNQLKVRYRCEYCGCIKEIIYNVKLVKEDWWD